ncbi:hypothetical protein GUJ93_ZPchr0015g6968 [Zizania palustris]|uniref:Uncharacterized protein n=1 Tax=Zizania palustris TaxID=103762 RepID=A0A8J5SYB7_ZIZPA|nr:hypothetical protein GUJ93_ZPchr0015g6968 [Zizania palustris]
MRGSGADPEVGSEEDFEWGLEEGSEAWTQRDPGGLAPEGTRGDQRGPRGLALEGQVLAVLGVIFIRVGAGARLEASLVDGLRNRDLRRLTSFGP